MFTIVLQNNNKQKKAHGSCRGRCPDSPLCRLRQLPELREVTEELPCLPLARLDVAFLRKPAREHRVQRVFALEDISRHNLALDVALDVALVHDLFSLGWG